MYSLSDAPIGERINCHILTPRPWLAMLKYTSRLLQELPIVNHPRDAPCDAGSAARNSNERTRQRNQIAYIPFSSRGCCNIHERRLLRFGREAPCLPIFREFPCSRYCTVATCTVVIVRAISNGTRGFCGTIY